MRDASELKRMDGFKYLASVPEGETIVSLVNHNGEIFAATDKHVYKLVDEKRLKTVDENG